MICSVTLVKSIISKNLIHIHSKIRLYIFPQLCIHMLFGVNKKLHKHMKKKNVTLKHKVSWMRSRVNVWLVVMNQVRRSWLVRFLVSHTPPRMSRNGHHKATCDHGECKRHVKPRNLMSVVSCKYVVGGNEPGTTLLTSAASNIIHATATNVEKWSSQGYLWSRWM